MLSRRRFLKGTVLVAAAAGCASESAGTSVSNGTSDTTATPGDAATEPAIEDGTGYFPNSVASGDPKPSSVVLWTRALVPTQPDAAVTLRLELSSTPDFSERISLTGSAGTDLTAALEHDHCVKVRVEGLTADSVYYYRFVLTERPNSDQPVRLASRTGTTRTAPAADAERAVRFAYVSCQDYNGRYYNAYKRLLALDPPPEFIVHLGDYVYETTADPRFQEASPDRAFTFTDKAGALTFDAGTETEYQAARSLHNYREMYRVYRSDPWLMAAHERFPFLITWDDHEFSDDSWREHGTYHNGAEDEADEERRRNASQAWTEYQPVDFESADYQYDRTKPLGEDVRVYRDLTWGKHCHLFLTDGRSHRPDHLVPEEAYPGAVAATEAELVAAMGAVPDPVGAVIDIDAHDEGAYKAPLVAAGGTASKITGKIGVAWINGVLEARAAAGETEDPPLISATDGLERGLVWADIGKASEYGSLGSRYFAIWDTFQAYAAVANHRTEGAAQDVLGKEQEAWLLGGLVSSPHTWKLWCSPFCATTHVVDLSSFASLPERFRKRWALVLDDYNGFPDKRDALIDSASAAGNVVVLSGDLHSFWASELVSRAGNVVVEFTGGAVSSGTLRQLLINAANSDPALKAAGAAALALGADSLLVDPATLPNPGLAFIRTNLQGLSVVDVSADAVTTAFHMAAEPMSKEDLDEAGVAAAYTTQRFQARAGEAALYGEVPGDADELVWKRWDRTTGAWAAG